MPAPKIEHTQEFFQRIADVRTIMQAARISQAAIAANMKWRGKPVSQQTVSKVLNGSGRYRGSLALLSELEKAVGAVAGIQLLGIGETLKNSQNTNSGAAASFSGIVQLAAE